jgi:hypothetical protein
MIHTHTKRSRVDVRVISCHTQSGINLASGQTFDCALCVHLSVLCRDDEVSISSRTPRIYCEKCELFEKGAEIINNSILGISLTPNGLIKRSTNKRFYSSPLAHKKFALGIATRRCVHTAIEEGTQSFLSQAIFGLNVCICVCCIITAYAQCEIIGIVKLIVQTADNDGEERSESFEALGCCCVPCSFQH